MNTTELDLLFEKEIDYSDSHNTMWKDTELSKDEKNSVSYFIKEFKKDQNKGINILKRFCLKAIKEDPSVYFDKHDSPIHTLFQVCQIIATGAIGIGAIKLHPIALLAEIPLLMVTVSLGKPEELKQTKALYKALEKELNKVQGQMKKADKESKKRLKVYYNGLNKAYKRAKYECDKISDNNREDLESLSDKDYKKHIKSRTKELNKYNLECALVLNEELFQLI